MGRGAILLGILCFAILGYWIAALNLDLPASGFFEERYAQRLGRRGPWGMWVLVLGGLGLIGWGLRALGIASDEGEAT